jgi:hypothetical protein
MKTLAPAAFAFAAVLAVSATADTQPSSGVGQTKLHGKSCFWAYDVNNFAAHDDKTLYLRVGVHDVYAASMFGNCFNLSWIYSHITLRSHDTALICEGSALDVDVIAPPETGFGRQRCPITSIRKLTPAEVAALPKDARP